MLRSMARIGLLAFLALNPGAPVAGQGADRQGMWCGEDPTLPGEGPSLESPDDLRQLGQRLLELLDSADRPPSALYFRSEAGDIRQLEGVIDVDVWFCVDPLGAVTKTRVSGLGGGFEDELAEAAGGLRFRPSTREGIPRTGVATLTFLLSTRDQGMPEEVVGRDRGAKRQLMPHTRRGSCGAPASQVRVGRN
jgi:hypothetical protein